jgi:hypothetical protein
MKSTQFLAAAMFAIAGLVPANAAEVSEIVVEALIDGGSAFHVRPDSIWWEHAGAASKPGKWSGQDQPTYINGEPWNPRWQNKASTGKDKTASHAVSLNTIDLEFELLGVSRYRGKEGVEERSPVSAKLESGHFVVRIPDPESEGRWYKFAIRKKKK